MVYMWYKVEAEVYKLLTNVYRSDDPELEYKNPAIIPTMQSSETLAENLQNQQNSAISWARCHSTLVALCVEALVRYEFKLSYAMYSLHWLYNKVATCKSRNTQVLKNLKTISFKILNIFQRKSYKI